MSQGARSWLGPRHSSGASSSVAASHERHWSGARPAKEASERHLDAGPEFAAGDRVAAAAVLRPNVGAARVLVERNEDRMLIDVEHVVQHPDKLHALAHLDLTPQVPHPERTLLVDRDGADLAGEVHRRQRFLGVVVHWPAQQAENL